MKFLLPQGIGDSVWALHKIQSVAKAHSASCIDVYLNCTSPVGAETRALDFVSRFSFVHSCRMLDVKIVDQNNLVDTKGRFIYIPDGFTSVEGGEYFVMMPNGPLERGIRLEDWLPEYETNWDVIKEFRTGTTESLKGIQLKRELGTYAVFFLGSTPGNTYAGHNRGPLWRPVDWIALGEKVQSRGLSIVVVGADYDLPYWETIIRPLLPPDSKWRSLIGETNVGELYSVTKNSNFIISYQSGVGIVSHYLGVPAGIFWRPSGDSLSHYKYISFSEDMATAWANPSIVAQGKYMPLIYKRHNPETIYQEICQRGWL